MTKRLGTDKFHIQKHAQIARKRSTYDKKTDKSKDYAINYTEYLFLYCLGKSPKPLAINEIEDAVGLERVRAHNKKGKKEKPVFRQNYVYKIKQKLFKESEFIPSKLIFTSDDFLRIEENEYKIELSEKFKVKLTQFFRDVFNSKDKEIHLSFNIINNYRKNENGSIITAIRISANDFNYIRIEINFTKLQNNIKKNTDSKPLGLYKNDLRIFIKSSLYKSEIEANVIKQREKGRLVIRGFDICPNYFLKNCFVA